MAETQQEKLALMYEMARSAKASNDATTAKKYYDMILAEDPLNWEPVFYSVYFTYATTKNGEIGNKTNEIKNCLSTSLLMIDKMSDAEEKKSALLDLKNSVSRIGMVLQSMSINFYNSLPGLAKDPLAKISRTIMIGDLLFTMGDGLRRNDLSKDANEIYKQAIELCESEAFLLAQNNPQQFAPTISRMDEAAGYIRQTEPEYLSKREKRKAGIQETNKKGGCYVATCVYGSYDCPEVWTLRRYRDDTLGSTWYGRAFIRVYYAISPTLVKWFGKTKWFKKMWQGKLDRMVKKLNAEGIENTPYIDKQW